MIEVCKMVYESHCTDTLQSAVKDSEKRDEL